MSALIALATLKNQYNKAEHNVIAVNLLARLCYVVTNGWEAVPYATDDEITSLEGEFEATTLGLTEVDMQLLEDHDDQAARKPMQIEVIDDNENEDSAPEPET
ncbi:hypothetical protein ColLi_06971 [Colletotrichum liriopes]|uniref:Uncharacterized protein n=1 Tax=Colletotrichum liriopes TaxID=708192 RepID=A0AA37LU58_9PEZI|nr:hypothetical protein ColLi_06971 [Colletotrichum liriopes]